MATKAEIENSLNVISSLASGLISKWFQRNVFLLFPLPQLLKWLISAEQNGHQS